MHPNHLSRCLNIGSMYASAILNLDPYSEQCSGYEDSHRNDQVTRTAIVMIENRDPVINVMQVSSSG